MEIYGTLGPSCCEKETLIKMLVLGMNGIRLNLSHCNLKDKKEWIQNYHEACKSLNIQGALLIDMKGPELRLPKSDEIIYLNKGNEITFSALGLPKEIMEHAFIDDVLLIDDGKLQMIVLENDHKFLKCKVLNKGYLKGSKSIAIQGKSITGQVLTDNDIENLKESKKYGVTGIMQPFVRNKEDLIAVKKVLNKLDLDLKIYAKIENREGLNHLDEIIEYCDHVIIARGDLGNAVGLIQLPLIQKEIEDKCKEKNKPYMVVTEMLHSMISNPTPTRAEVSDIFHAVYNGASSIMLTAETAIGEYPVEAMVVFSGVANEAKKARKK